MTNQHLTSKTVRETKEIACKLAQYLSKGSVLGLSGELGSGKTTFIQGLAEGLNLKPGYQVTSPTYTLIQSYLCRDVLLHHMDFYRLKTPHDIYSLGLEDFFTPRAICVVEWFEKSPNSLPRDRLEVSLRWVNENQRQISLDAKGPKSLKVLKNFF